MFKSILFVFIVAALCFADSTSVKILFQHQTTLNSLAKRQIGINDLPDADLGYRMWGGVDTSGNITQWLAKNQPIRVTVVKADSVYSRRDSTAVLKCDSSSQRSLYFGVDRGGKATEDTLIVNQYLILSRTPVDHFVTGAVWNDSGIRATASYTNNIYGFFNRNIFSAFGAPMDSNSAAETSLRGVDSETLFDSLSSGWFRNGKRLRIALKGIYSTHDGSAGGPGTITINVKLNGTNIMTTGAIALPNSESNTVWSIDGTLMSTSTTATTGTLKGAASWVRGVAAVQNGAGMYAISTAINPSLRYRPDVTATFSAAFTTNKITCILFTLTEEH